MTATSILNNVELYLYICINHRNLLFNCCCKDHQVGRTGRIRGRQGKYNKYHSPRNSRHLQ